MPNLSLRNARAVNSGSPSKKSLAARPLLLALALGLGLGAAPLVSSSVLADVPEQDYASGPLGVDLELTVGPQTGACHNSSTLAKGQKRIDQGRYEEAIAIFTCVINANPLTIDAYRGRSEAKLLLGRFSDAFRDYARLNAVVVPVHPDAGATMLASYDARLAAQPSNVAALTGASFAKWCFYDYTGAIPLLDQLIAIRASDVYATLFRGSNRLFAGVDVAGGEADFTRAIQLAPFSADVRYIIADGYTYAHPDLPRAFTEASLALQWGLDTPRVHAILAAYYLSVGNLSSGAAEIDQHIDLVTTETIGPAALSTTSPMTIDLAPGRTYEFSVAAVAGQTISIATDSPSGEIWDSILVLLAPNGTPITGSDDYVAYFAGLDWVAPATGTYTLRVTSFEGISTGELVVTRN